MEGIKKRRATARKVSNERYSKRREAVIAAAAKVFKENGLAGTSIHDIAEATGLNRASLYYYVGNKHELFNEVVVGVVKQNVKMAEEIREEKISSEEKIKLITHNLLRSYQDNYPHVHVFMQEDFSQIPATSDKSGFAELQRRFDRALIGIVEEGIQRGEFRGDLSVRLVAFGLIGMINWTHRWFHPDGPVSFEEVAHVFARMSLEGLRKSE